MPDYQQMRAPLRRFCNARAIKGTILLSHEGINIFLSAARKDIDAFVEHIQEDERFANLTVKYSQSETCSFRRMNVRLKKEIISMGVESVRPADFSGPHIDPLEFNVSDEEYEEDDLENLIDDQNLIRVSSKILNRLHPPKGGYRYRIVTE